MQIVFVLDMKMLHRNIHGAYFQLTGSLFFQSDALKLQPKTGFHF